MEWARHPGLHKCFSSETALIFDLAELRIPSDLFYKKRVLVLGTGIHRFAYLAIRAGASLAMRAEIRNGRRPARLSDGACCRTVVSGRNPLELPFREEKFDSLLLFDVLGHAVDPRDPLRLALTAVRLLRPGGRVAIGLEGVEVIWLPPQSQGRHKDRRSIAEFLWLRRLPRLIRYGVSAILVFLRSTPILKWAMHAVNHYLSVVWRDRRKSLRTNVEITYRKWGGDLSQTIKIRQDEALDWLAGAELEDLVVRAHGSNVFIYGTRAKGAGAP